MGLFKSIGKAIKRGAKKISHAWQTSKLRKLGAKALDKVKEAVEGSLDWLDKQWTKLKTWINDHVKQFFKKLKEIFEKMWDKIKEVAQNLVDGFKNILEGIKDFTVDFIEGLIEGVRQGLGIDQFMILGLAVFSLLLMLGGPNE